MSDDHRAAGDDRRPRLAHDPAVPRTVFVAPNRADRPIDQFGAARHRCPFCAGQESLTPEEVCRRPHGAPGSGWTARIIPNRYPVVWEATAPPAAGPSARADTAHGVHEVLVESPRHDTCVVAIDPQAWRESWILCRERLADLATRGDLAWTTVFKNAGPAAGASLEHVHSQLVGLGFVPPVAEAEFVLARRGTAPFAALIESARHERRIVAECGALVALVPPAPRQPYETWILPLDARPHFHADAAAATIVADLTRRVIGRLLALEPGANYNWWLHQAPLREAIPPGWHWHLEILPRLSGFAGFELATGCHITTAGAVESARRLRTDT